MGGYIFYKSRKNYLTRGRKMKVLLTAINSTFLNPSSTILLTALPPPPPQPMTFILVNSCISNSKSNKTIPPLKISISKV